MMDVITSVPPTVPFGDIGRNRHARAPDLTGELVLFDAGKLTSQPACGDCQIHGQLPHTQIAIAPNWGSGHFNWMGHDVMLALAPDIPSSVPCAHGAIPDELRQ